MTNKTALVTGASDGIGLDFCTLLAQRNYNLILVARREDKLNIIAKTLTETYGIQCTVIVADLSEPKAAQTLFGRVREKGFEVDFLINNAGLLHNGFFNQLDLGEQEKMMTVNMLALTALTHLFANDMARRKSGHILNLSSLAAWMPIPNQNVYAASKAYVLSFTQALSDEMLAAKSGVNVSALCPGYTATKMMDNPAQGETLRIAPKMMMASAVVAELGINGCLAGKTTIVPGLSNKITAAITHLFPKMLLTKFAGKFYRNNMG